MKLALVDYSQISASYQLAQPFWLKVVVVLVAITSLAIGAFFVEKLQSAFVTVGFVLILAVFCLGFVKQRSTGIWSPILANEQVVYIIASASGKEFLQVPWRYFQSIKRGMHGLNSRGLIISINSTLLDDSERNLIRDCLNVTEDDETGICISVPTGIVDRARAIQDLADLKKLLNEVGQ